MPVAENIARIREQMKAAASRAGRNVDDITLMAVSKTVSPDLIRAAHLAGLRVFGENRVQEFAEKAGALRDLSDAEWHMIGHLQTNKAAKAAELFAGVDSIDSLRLAQKLFQARHAFVKDILGATAPLCRAGRYHLRQAASTPDVRTVCWAPLGLRSARVWIA